MIKILVKTPTMAYKAEFEKIDEARLFISQHLKTAMIEVLKQIDRPMTVSDIVNYYEREFKALAYSDLKDKTFSDYAQKDLFCTDNV